MTAEYGRGSGIGLYLENQRGSDSKMTTAGAEQLMGERCPLCVETGREGRLELRQINAFEALWICGNLEVSCLHVYLGTEFYLKYNLFFPVPVSNVS